MLHLEIASEDERSQLMITLGTLVEFAKARSPFPSRPGPTDAVVYDGSYVTPGVTTAAHGAGSAGVATVVSPAAVPAATATKPPAPPTPPPLQSTASSRSVTNGGGKPSGSPAPPPLPPPPPMGAQ